MARKQHKSLQNVRLLVCWSSRQHDCKKRPQHEQGLFFLLWLAYLDNQVKTSGFGLPLQNQGLHNDPNRHKWGYAGHLDPFQPLIDPNGFAPLIGGKVAKLTP